MEYGIVPEISVSIIYKLSFFCLNLEIDVFFCSQGNGISFKFIRKFE